MTNMLNYAGPMTEPRRHDRAAWWWARVWYFVAGIAVPATCWITSFATMDPPHPDWQSGKINDIAGLFLMGQVSFPMFLLMLYTMAALMLLLVNRDFFSRWFAVRLGIYTGLVIAAIFTVIHAIGSEGLGIMVGGATVVCGGGSTTALWWLVRKLRPKWTVIGLFSIAGIGVLIQLAAMVLDGPETLIAAPATAWFLSITAGPAVTFYAMLLMSIWLLRNGPTATPLVVLSGACAWGMTFLGSAWLTAIMAMRQYASLPTEAPSKCYIATAAAKGHAGFVGADGDVPVNRQLRVLKAGEILIRTFAPRAHGLMRAIYDWLGPKLAARIRGPLAADAAYVALKIFEWPTAMVLKATGLWPMAMRLYRSK